MKNYGLGNMIDKNNGILFIILNNIPLLTKNNNFGEQKMSIDLLDTITNSVKSFTSADHNMVEDSLIDSYFRGDICDIEDRLQKKFFRKYSQINPGQCSIDIDFNYEY
jgi:hypothetical protein